MSQKIYIFTLKIIFKINIKSIHNILYDIIRFFVLDEYIIIIGNLLLYSLVQLNIQLFFWILVTL